MAATTNGEHVNGVSTTATSDYVKELQKNIRNITKKLSAMHKTDAVIAEHPGVSLDELVAQRKINADQKASALKKPQLQQQLTQLEAQIDEYKKVDAAHQSSLSKQKDELTQAHTQELDRVREEARQESVKHADGELRSKLLVFSQFLRAAASKRSDDGSVETEESKAFEGALLLVYGGDQKAVDAALKIINGSDEKVPDTDAIETNYTFAQINQASVEHSPFQLEEAWVDSVAEATVAGSDPTLTHAGLTEVQAGQTEALTSQDAPESQPLSADASNAAGDRWDTNATSSGVDAALEESYEVIPRPDEEVEAPASQPANAVNAANIIEKEVINGSTSWADSPPAYDTLAAASTTYAPSTVPEADGFQEVAGRSRGGRGRGNFHRGDGEHRGRGRGRGRGGFGGRGRGDGEFRGRGGRGRGQRGDGPPKA